MKYHILVFHESQTPDWDALIKALKGQKSFIVHAKNSMKSSISLIQNDLIHIMIVDFDIQEDSIKFLKKVKSLNPSIELIFLAKQATLEKAIETMRNGAYDFYEFPVNSRLLITVIEKAIEKGKLFIEKNELEKQIKEEFDYGNILGRSKVMQSVLEKVKTISSKDVNILITGETGTGKELIASAIHNNSTRASKPLVKINCAALGEGVLESELFGHERGAFTGAISTRIGRFEMAHEGTVFLDEIGNISMGTQAKLLRVIQENEFERVGGNETKKVDVRVLAATNKDLIKLVVEEKFREDLYFRLNVVNIHIPPLRERLEAIPLLVSSFIKKLNTRKGYNIRNISKEAMQVLLKYQWPGNVRELENAIECSMALAEKDIIEAKYLPPFLFATHSEANFYHIPENLTLQEIEERIITQTLLKTKGNKSRAAKLLGVCLRTLQRKTK